MLMLTTRRQFFALAAGASTLGAVRSHPELAVVSRLGADHPLILAQISQLLENGVYFDTREDHALRESLPESLEGFKAVLFDQPALHATINDPGARSRLEAWVKNG